MTTMLNIYMVLSLCQALLKALCVFKEAQRKSVFLFFLPLFSPVAFIPKLKKFRHNASHLLFIINY